MEQNYLRIKEQLEYIENYLEQHPFILDKTGYKNTELLTKLRIYYEQAKWHILKELAKNMLIRFHNTLEKKKTNLESNGTLLIGTQINKPLLYMFLKDQNQGTFNNTIFEKGIFERSLQGPTIENPDNYLFLEGIKKDPYCIQHIKFTFDLLYLTEKKQFDSHHPYLTDSTLSFIYQQKKLKDYRIQKNNLKKEDYNLLHDFFLETSPQVLSNLLKQFLLQLENYKQTYNVALTLTAPLVNTNNPHYLIVLQSLYQNLLHQPEFKKTIFETAQVGITKPTRKKDPLHDLDLENKEGEHYNLKLSWNPYDLERKKSSIFH